MSTKAVTGYTPTFLLRGVDPITVFQRYLAGEFHSVTEPPSKITFVKGVSAINPDRGDDASSETYTYRDKTNTRQTIVTTNHAAFVSTQGGVRYKPNKCIWCRRSLENIPTDPVGIPVQMDRDTVTGRLVFHEDQPYHCRPECMLANLRRRQANRIYRETMYIDAESLANLRHQKITGTTECIKEAKDWLLYHENGGPLDDEEYFKNSTYYHRSSNIICIPAKVEYFVLG